LRPGEVKTDPEGYRGAMLADGIYIGGGAIVLILLIIVIVLLLRR
jgi:hypothetical protein